MDFSEYHNSDVKNILIDIVSLILSIFKLDNKYFSPLLRVLSFLFEDSFFFDNIKNFFSNISNFNNEDLNNTFYTNFLEFLKIILIFISSFCFVKLIFNYNFIFNKIKLFFICERKICIYDQEIVNIFLNYINENCEFKQNEKIIGDYDITRYNLVNDNKATFNLNLPNLEEYIDFYDRRTKKKGYFRISKNIISENKKCMSCKNNILSTPLPYFILTLNLENINNINNYIEDIKEYMKKYSKKVELKSIRIFYNEQENKYNFQSCIFYSGNRKTKEELKELHIDTFFHEKKEEIFNYLDKIQYHPEFFEHYGQMAKSNIILYGPSGSGKSSFIKRIAKALGRHIVNLDIGNIKEKEKVYELLQKPSVDGIILNPSDIIFVFEEFDITIKNLYEREQLIQTIKNKILKLKSLLNIDMNFDEVISSDEDILLKKEQSKKNNKFYNYLNKDLNEENSDEYSDEESDEESDNEKELNLDNLMKAIEIYNSMKNQFILRDLLDIFEGTVPIDKSIIFGTTNKIEEIKKLAPKELLRDGRLTTTYFGYFKQTEFNNFLNTFFEKSTNNLNIHYTESGELNIPTSKIVETALKANSIYSNKDEAFDFFKQKLKLN